MLSQIKEWNSLKVNIRLAAITEKIHPNLNLSTKECLSLSKQFKEGGSSHVGFLGSSAPSGDPGFRAPSILWLRQVHSSWSNHNLVKICLTERVHDYPKGCFLAQPGSDTHLFCHTSLISLARPQITVRGERGIHAI